MSPSIHGGDILTFVLNMHGKLIFKYGTMSSGKSLQLIATANNFQEHGIPFIIFKSSMDTRDGEGVVFSRAIGTKECINITATDNLYSIISSFVNNSTLLHGESLKWILVDEAQFLSKKQVDELAAIADNLKINVLCYGLRTDFKTRLFEGSQRLFEIADSIDEIKSSCFCGSKTIFNARLNADGTVATDGEQIEIGGDERYTALCRKCYFDKIRHPLYKAKETED